MNSPHQLRCFVFTCNKYLWCLKPFAYLFNSYWSSLQPVVVAGYNPPDFTLPNNFVFHSMNETEFPVDRWTNGVIKFLNSVDDTHFVMFLEDYWLNRMVNHAAVQSLYEYMLMHPEVARMDLGTDRLYAHDPRYMPDYDRHGPYNLIKSNRDWPYHMSLMPSIWNKHAFLKSIYEEQSPWDVELQDQVGDEYLVLGCRQIPLQITIGVRVDKAFTVLDGIDVEHVRFMREQGWIQRDHN